MSKQTSLLDLPVEEKQPEKLPQPQYLSRVYGIASGGGISAREFFAMMKDVGITLLIDTRVQREYSSARFSYEEDLRYICELNSVEYMLGVEFMPTPAIRERFHRSFADVKYEAERDPAAWTQYLESYGELLELRQPLREGTFHEKVLQGTHGIAAMLCHCPHRHDCHRSYALGLINKRVEGVEIRDLYPDPRHEPKRASPRRYRLRDFPEAGLLADLPPRGRRS